MDVSLHGPRARACPGPRPAAAGRPGSRRPRGPAGGRARGRGGSCRRGGSPSRPGALERGGQGRRPPRRPRLPDPAIVPRRQAAASPRGGPPAGRFSRIVRGRRPGPRRAGAAGRAGGAKAGPGFPPSAGAGPPGAAPRERGRLRGGRRAARARGGRRARRRAGSGRARPRRARRARERPPRAPGARAGAAAAAPAGLPGRRRGRLSDPEIVSHPGRRAGPPRGRSGNEGVGGSRAISMAKTPRKNSAEEISDNGETRSRRGVVDGGRDGGGAGAPGSRP